MEIGSAAFKMSIIFLIIRTRPGDVIKNTELKLASKYDNLLAICGNLKATMIQSNYRRKVLLLNLVAG